MKSIEPNNSLRLVRMAAESILRERILLKEHLDRSAMTLIAGQIEGLVRALQAEWETDSASGELREGFHLLSDYVSCLTDRL